MPTRPAIIPCLRYDDAPAAIEFLCAAFGFERHAIYADPEDPNVIHHAQLVREGQMIMLSTAQDSEFSRAAPMLTAAEAKGNTQSAYVVVADVDAHAARARQAGAHIYMEPRDQDYGGRGYGARDLEGNAWSFGSYDPFAQPV